MIHVPSALTVDSSLLKKFLNYKLSSLSDLYLRYHAISETMVFCWESPSTRRERWNDFEDNSFGSTSCSNQGG